MSSFKHFRRAIRGRIVTYLSRRYLRSWATNYEDLILDSFFDKSEGFYIDVGGNHPVNDSNSYKFYRKGWTGIVVEPNPVLYELHVEKRPNDTNLNVAVSTEAKKVPFYIHQKDGISSLVREHVGKLKEVIEVNCLPLSRIVSDYVPNRKIDFLSVDTEGHDLEVLKSFPWESVNRPTIVVVETYAKDPSILNAMKGWGYVLFYHSGVNSFFINAREL